MLGNRNGSTWKSGRERTEAHNGNAEERGRTSAVALALLTRVGAGAREILGLGLRGQNFCIRLREIEAHQPFTRYALVRHLCRSKIPVLGGLNGSVAEKLAGTSSRLGPSNGARRIDMNFYNDAHGAVDRASGFGRNLGKHLIQNLPLGNSSRKRTACCSRRVYGNRVGMNSRGRGSGGRAGARIRGGVLLEQLLVAGGLQRILG
jgi:hypothetical protein